MKTKTTKAILEILNTGLKKDAGAIHALICNRVPCNKELADDTFIVVETNKVVGGFNVGLLGIINGVLSKLGEPLVAAQFDEETNKLVGFCVYNDSQK